MSQMCERCAAGPQGEAGHPALSFYVGGPYPGHQIHKCATCNERWIRHYGSVDRFGWTRYSLQFPPIPRRTSARRGGASVST